MGKNPVIGQGAKNTEPSQRIDLVAIVGERLPQVSCPLKRPYFRHEGAVLENCSSSVPICRLTSQKEDLIHEMSK